MWPLPPSPCLSVIHFSHPLIHDDDSLTCPHTQHLGCGRGFASDTRDDQIKPTSDFADLCQPTKNWRLMYNHDPLANLSPEAVKNVRGGEVATWTETIDPTSLDTIVWPRAAAAAEVWWSGRSGEDGILRSIYNARPRLDEMRQGMLARGINAALIVAGFCGQSPLADCA